MAKPAPLPVWDRDRNRLIHEWMEDSRDTYESHPHRSIGQIIKSHPLYDQLYAFLQNTRWSARKIGPFIRKYRINMEEYEPVLYRSYADFFVRRFRAGMRLFPAERHFMGAFVEARYFAWQKTDAIQDFPVKGRSLNAAEILGNAAHARLFAGGPVFLARLAPVDYHRVHYPDDGKTLHHQRLGQRLWTVNWRALLDMPDILIRNEREVNILETTNFGRLGFVEIGAMTVGRIVPIHPYDLPFRRGDEKSLFQFGGSAVAVFGEPGAWRPSDDLLEHTSQGIETFVRLGEPIAEAY